MLIQHFNCCDGIEARFPGRSSISQGTALFTQFEMEVDDLLPALHMTMWSLSVFNLTCLAASWTLRMSSRSHLTNSTLLSFSPDVLCGRRLHASFEFLFLFLFRAMTKTFSIVGGAVRLFLNFHGG